MNYSIQQLTINELVDIVSIVHKGIKEDFPMYDKNTQLAYIKLFGRKYFRKLLTTKSSAVLGAFVKNKLVGILVVKGDIGGVAYIEWFIVKKEFRIQGIGTTLLNECDIWALKHKYHYVYLNTETNKNINYYKKRGYEYIGTFRKSWFGADEYAMQKILRDKPFTEIFDKYLTK